MYIKQSLTMPCHEQTNAHHTIHATVDDYSKSTYLTKPVIHKCDYNVGASMSALMCLYSYSHWLVSFPQNKVIRKVR